MPALKPLEAILEPDPWWDALAMFDGQRFRRRMLADHHAFIEAIRLAEHVPSNVRLLFDSARNVYLCAFFAHRLLMVADLQAYVSVEFALREKATQAGRAVPEWWGMSRLFKLAIEETWIIDDGFEIHRRKEEFRRREASMYAKLDPDLRCRAPSDPQAYCRILAESFPSLRNMHAHGSETMYPSVLGTSEIVADIIHQLFPRDAVSPVG